MNEGKTNRARRRRVVAIALTCVLALLASPLCPLNCSGTGCRKAQTTSMSEEECHGGAQTGFTQIRTAKIMVCDAPALAARSERTAELLRRLSILGAGSSTAEAVNLTALIDFFGEHGPQWQLLRRPDLHPAEALSNLALRV